MSPCHRGSVLVVWQQSLLPVTLSLSRHRDIAAAAYHSVPEVCRELVSAGNLKCTITESQNLTVHGHAHADASFISTAAKPGPLPDLATNTITVTVTITARSIY